MQITTMQQRIGKTTLARWENPRHTRCGLYLAEVFHQNRKRQAIIGRWLDENYNAIHALVFIEPGCDWYELGAYGIYLPGETEAVGTLLKDCPISVATYRVIPCLLVDSKMQELEITSL